MRFLLDENLPSAVADLFREKGHDVLDIADSPHRGVPDTEIWQLAVAEQRVLISRDLDFPLRGVAHRPPGMLLLRPGKVGLTREFVAQVQAMLDHLEVERLLGAVTILTPERIRQRPYESLP